MRRILILCVVMCALSLSAAAQSAPEPATLVPGQTVEREIAGGESHAYQISLTPGQFARFRLEQRAIDSTLTLSAPGGKQLAEINLTGAGEEEWLSAEATAAGSYRLTVRADGAATLRGSYRLETAVRATATAQDRKRLPAEALLVEANELSKQAGKTAQQVLEKAQQALSIWRELGEPSWTAYALFMTGDAYAGLNQHEKAMEVFEQVLAMSRASNLRARESLALNNLGVANYSLGRFEKAIEYYEQALAIAREVGDRAGEGRTLNHMGEAYDSLSRYEKAIEYYEQALAIAREVGDRLGEGVRLGNIGVAYHSMDRPEMAVKYYEQALAIAREVKDRTGEATALTNLGLAYRMLGQTEKAIEYYERALPIRREVKDWNGEAITLSNLGAVYGTLGLYEKTVEYYEQSLVIRREIRDRAGEGLALSNVGMSYYNVRRPEKAIEYFEQSLSILQEVKQPGRVAVTLNNLGAAWRLLGHHDRSIEYYERALAMNRELKQRAGEGLALNNLGVTYNAQGRPEKAIWHFEQALAIARELKDRVGEGRALNNLGRAYVLLHRPEQAMAFSEQALAILREVKERNQELTALSDLAWAAGERGDLAQARIYAEEGVRVAESLRSAVSSPASRASLLASVQSSYQLYTDILMRQHKAEPTKGLDALALEISERQRARSLLDLLAEANTNLREGVDPALIERERTLAKQLNDKARTTAGTPEAAAALKLEISQLETDLERAQVGIRKANPHYAALTQPQPLKLTEIQAQLDPDTLLLEYALGEERSYLWAITKDSLASYELPKEEQIKQSALAVYELLTTRSTNKRGETALERRARISQAEAKLPATAQQLSQTLLAPIAAQLGNKRLVIVADGALQYIPFAMLPEPVVGDRSSVVDKNPPLIVKHEVVSLPSASALAIQRAELAARKPAPKLLAVIADPVFDRTDERFKSVAMKASDTAPAPTIGFNDARSIEHLAEKSDDKAGGTTRRLVIPRLPFTRQEATRLLALTPKNSSFSATDFQASRENVLNSDLSQYRYVHFATHGLLDSERPGLSSLVLSMVDEKGQPQNGFLRANDIYNLKLPAELVVLSACQTGLGKEIKGEGLVGLTRGFMYAGAARVVVSLWSVNDKATADLMATFYERMLKRGERPAAALRAAQVEMWKQKQWQSPYYWAAFTMQGEWR
jgi:CHAT domain-containing protein/Tfp pilus assembly protein PilF